MEIIPACLAQPLTAILVGGVTKPYRFDARVVRDLVQETRRATDGAGTLYFTTSRRTPKAVADALEANLPERARLFRWAPGAPDNPYLGLLAHAQRFVVTGDCISMMVEVARLGRPLALFALPVEHPLLARLRRGYASFLLPSEERGWRPGRALGARLFRLGLVGYPRDLTAMHEALIDRGLAVRLGEPFPAGGPGAEEEVEAVVKRMRTLVT